MGLAHSAFQYLDKGQNKRTNAETLLYLVLGSIVLLFLPFIILLLKATNLNIRPANVLSLFGLSTLCLILSSILLSLGKQARLKDHSKNFKLYLILSLLLGLLFLTFQYWSWLHLLTTSIPRQRNIMVVIVLVHALHFVVALYLLTRMLVLLFPIKTAADLYIFFLNPRNRLFFKNCKTYWDFLGVLWIGVYVVLLVKNV